MGGGFGGKVDTLTEPLAILGAMLTGRPVRYVLDREEEMLYGSPRGAERIYVKDGLMRDGRIIARHIRSYFDAGAYTRLSSYAAVKCTAHVPGPYWIPNVSSDIYVAYTNRCPSTAMRGFGITAVDFALEVQMDKLAHAVNMDPMEFRILNAYRDGDMKAHRRVAKNTALIECVQVAAEKARWPISESARRQSSLEGGGEGERGQIPATPIDQRGQIGRPETRNAPATQTLPAGTMRIPLTKQPELEGSRDGRPVAPNVPRYEPARPMVQPAVQAPAPLAPLPPLLRRLSLARRLLPRPRQAPSLNTARCASPRFSEQGGGEMARHKGRGMAAVNYPIGMNLGGDPSQALIHSNPDGKFTVALSAIDLGQGMKQVTRQVAAETLGVPIEDVYVDTADSDTGPHDMGSFASRGTHRMGNAVIAAAREARGVLLEAAAEELEVNAADLVTDGRGNIHVRGAPSRSITVRATAQAAQFKQGKTIAGRGIFLIPLSAVDPETGEMNPNTAFAHACLVADVEVDDETGEVTLLGIDERL